MMKSRINLYSASLLPPKLRLTFTRLSLALAATVLLSLMFAAFLTWESQNLMAQIYLTQSQADELNDEKARLEREIAARKPSQNLVDKFQLAEQRLRLKQGLKGELLQRNAVVNPGYSQLLTELASVSDSSSWLSRISVREGVYEFEGFGQTPQSIPQWIERLKSSQILTGYAFSSMTLDRGEGSPLAFKLSSKLVDSDDKEAK
jgi:Tfp pilus assembly protein PilN